MLVSCVTDGKVITWECVCAHMCVNACVCVCICEFTGSLPAGRNDQTSGSMGLAGAIPSLVPGTGGRGRSPKSAGAMHEMEPG